MSRIPSLFAALGVLLSACVCFSAEKFLIPPYLFSIKGQAIAAAWTYGPGYSVPDHVTVELDKDGVKTEIPADFDNGLYSAVLPIGVCGFGGGVTYRVTGQDAPVKINDIPCAGSSDNVRFTFLADSQEGYQIAGVFAKQIQAYNGCAVLHGGDVVQTGDSYQEWVDILQSMSPAISNQLLVPAVGNHEYRWDKNVPFWKYFFKTEATDAYYATDIGPVHVMALNSNFDADPSLRLKELVWLQQELEKPARWRVIFFHHPAYSKAIANNPMAPHENYKVLQADFIPLFEHYKVDLVLNGHTHIFEHSLKDGINYVTVGPAGGKMGIYGAENPYSLTSERIRTIVELEANRNSLRAVSVTLEGKTIDEFTLQKTGAVQALP